MLIAITAAVLIAIGSGAFVILFAATAMTHRTVDRDPSLEEQPIENWGLATSNSTLTTRMNTR